MVMLLKAVVTIQNSLKAGVLVWLQNTILLKALSPAVTEWCERNLRNADLNSQL